MAQFTYRAANDAGAISKGQIDALNEIDLESQLKNMGLQLVSAKALPARKGYVQKMARRDVIDFLFHLEMLTRAGVPLLSCLGDMRDEADSPTGRELSAGLYEKIEAGSTFSEAIAAFPGIFSPTITSLIRAGELTGQLPDVLKEIVRSLKWQDELAATTKKLLTYPSFMIVVISGVVFFLMVYLVPQLVTFIASMGKELPFHTRLLIAVSDVFVRFWWLILGIPPALVAIVSAAAAANPKIRFKLHQIQLDLPYLGPILKKLILARFADTFALMYKTGIPLIDGLTYCLDVSENLVIKQSIRQARDRVLTGTVLSESFALERLFPSLVIRMLKVGESTGALDTSLSNISYFYSRDIDESVGKVQAMIEPALTVTMGLILGWIMVSVLGPIYDTISTIKF
ncbi:MAG: type II secretion system F family protein [Oxalobacteraceae bacterium]|nr:type II secretion system F family protein [Oxalobacteraceae bacterium]